MATTVSERVARGADWLDRVDPGWEQKIDPETLDLRSGCDCICGQVFHELARGMGGYAYVRDQLRPHNQLDAPGWGSWSAWHGFTVDAGEMNERYQRVAGRLAEEDQLAVYQALDRTAWNDLQEEWEALIEARQNEPIAPYRQPELQLALA